jgi:hypothetical protein
LSITSSSSSSQPKPWVDKIKCSKCLLGHKQSGCRKEAFSDHGDDSSSESDTMENEKKEDHIDDEDEGGVMVYREAFI